MGLKEQAQRRLRNILDQKQNQIRRSRGILGNGGGVVVVPERPDYRYVRQNADSGKVVKVLYHPLVPNIDGLPVIMEQEPDSEQWKLTEVDRGTLAQVGNGWGGISLLGTHHEDHEWETFSPGPDPISVFPRAIASLRTEPTVTYSMDITVRPYVYTYEGLVKRYKGGQYSLATYVPGSGQRYVLTYLDTRYNTMQTLTGNPVAYSIALNPPVPRVPWYGVPSALIKLRQNQNIVTETDIESLPRDREGIVHNLTAQRAPTTSDDATLGYGPGSWWINRDANTAYVCLNGAIGAADWDQVNGGAGGGAPTDAQYVTLAANGTLTDERVLTAGDGIELADGGAGSTITARLDIDGLTEETTADDDDTIAIYDDTAAALKKMTRANFLDGVGGGWPLAGVITVGTDGDFATVDDAIGDASDGDVILVDVGIHEFSSTINVNKAVEIRGVSKDLVIFKHTGSGYALAFNADATVKNVTLWNPTTTTGVGVVGVGSGGYVATLENCRLLKDGVTTTSDGVTMGASDLNLIDVDIVVENATNNRGIVSDSTCEVVMKRGSINSTIALSSSDPGATIKLQGTNIETGTISWETIDGASWWTDTDGSLITSTDVTQYVGGAGRGLITRTLNRNGLIPTEHFRSGSIPSGYSWVGTSGVFFGTPSTLSYSLNGDYLGTTATAATRRHFLQKAIANDISAWSSKVFDAMFRAGGPCEMGIRIDAGDNTTDGRFLEFYSSAVANDGTHKLEIRKQETHGGGVTVVPTSLVKPMDSPFFIRILVVAGPRITCYVLSEDGQVQSLHQTGILDWIPSAGRVGIFVKEKGFYSMCDLFYTTF